MSSYASYNSPKGDIDSSVVDALSDPSPVKRSEALEQLRHSVRQANGHIHYQDLGRLFSTLGDLLEDSNWNVCHQCLQLLAEVTPQLGSSGIDAHMLSLFPKLVTDLGDSKVVIRKASLSTLTSLAKHMSNVSSLLNALIAHGLESGDARVRQETCQAISSLFKTEQPSFDYSRLLEVLVLLLGDPNDGVVRAANSSLSDLESTVSGFDGYIKTLGSSLQNIYQNRVTADSGGNTPTQGRPPRVARSPVNNLPSPLSPATDVTRSTDSNGSLRSQPTYTPSKSAATSSSSGSMPSVSNGKEFGFIPLDMIELLQNDSNWKIRAQAIEELQYIVFRLEDSGPLLPHLQPLMIFLTNLLDDPNFKISLTTLQIIGDLIGKVGMAIRPVTQTVLSALIEKLGDNKIVIRQANMKVISKLLQILTPKPILSELLLRLNHSNWHVREEIINTVIQALLVYRRYDFEYDTLVPQLLSVLNDSKPKVKFVATEALAVVNSLIGDRIHTYLTSIDDAARQALYERFSNTTLPHMNADGLVEHQAPRELMSRQESRQGFRTARDIQVPTSAGPAPRISSAGRAASRGKIPWDMPPSRQSSASRRSRRNQEAAEDYVDNDVLLDDYPETGADGGDDLVLLGGGGSSPAGRNSSKRRTAKTPRSRGPLTQQVRWDDQPIPSKTPRREKEKNPLWLPSEDTDPNDRHYVASPEEYGARGRREPSEVTDVDRRMYRSLDETANRSARPHDLDVHRSMDGGVMPPASPQDIADKLSLLKRRSHTANSKQSAGSSVTFASSSALPAGGGNGEGQMSGRRARTAAPARPIDPDERRLPAASKTTRFEDHPDPFGQSTRSAGVSHDDTPIGGGAKNDWLDSAAAMEGAYPTPEEQSRIESAQAARRSAPKLSQATMRRRAATSAKAARIARDSEDGSASPASAASASAASSVRSSRSAHSAKARAATVSSAGGAATTRSVERQAAKPLEEIATEDLTPMNNPERGLRQAMKDLDGDREAWEKVFEGINALRRLTVHHPEVVLPQLHSVVLKAIVQMDNLRSQLSKTAVIVFSDMFNYLGRSMDPELETVVPALLSKAASSGFIVDEVDKALESMIHNCSQSRALATLLSQGQHRNKTVRVKSSQFIEMAAVAMGSRIAGRDFDRLAPVLLKLLQDSHQDARHAAKRTAVAISDAVGRSEFEHMVKRLTGDSGAKKFMDVIAKGVETFSSGPTTGRRTTRGYTAASPKARSHTIAASASSVDYPEEAAAPPRRSATSGRRRTTAAASSVSTPKDFDGLPQIFSSMAQSDWRHRQQAVNQLCDLILKHPEAAANKVVNIFDHFTRCLSDANSKVNLSSLQAMLKIVPALGSSLDAVLTNLTPVLASNLSSGNTTIRSVTSELFDELIANVDMPSLLQSMTNIVSYGNPRVKALLLEKLADSVAYVYSVKPSLLSKYMLPVCFKLLSENKGEIKTANAHLLQELYIMLDDTLFEHTHSLSASQLQRLKTIIEA